MSSPSSSSASSLASSSSSSSSSSSDHLCVLVHGLWGNPSHLSYLSTSLAEAHPELHILVTKSNANSFTYDGIDLGGERITNEIEEKISTLEEGGCVIRKISLIGYSLGGLVARYAIGLLYSRGCFDKIEPVNFTTFASPHLGVRTPLLGPQCYLWNVLGARTLSESGRQLFTVDSFRDTARPLLSVMADPNSIFIRALSKFKHRSLYCNIVNDRSTVYYTAGIDSSDPYVDLDAVDLQPLPGYDGVILNPEGPVRLKVRNPETFLARFRRSSRNTLTTLPIAVLMVVLIPIGSALFLLNSAYQTIRSAQRVRLHEAGRAGFGIERYRIPLIEDAKALTERVYEHLNNRHAEDYLPTPPPEEATLTKTATTTTTTTTTATTTPAADKGDVQSPSTKVNGRDKFPTLALTHEQFQMIESLDNVGFVKYPVHISKARHSHAAIIVRMKWRGFPEGKIVVRHWLEHFKV